MRLVLGVIGHVDHGKTSLVRALTGTETDRLPEEKRRGISIALGFAHLAVPGGTIDFIDMPGHERFVRTMVSGATGMDAALLVVAANEGIKPQTVEHLDIAGLLGVARAIVAVSKVELVDPGTAEAVGEEAAALAGRAGLLAGAPVLTSAATGAGLDALRAALAAAAAEAAEDAGFPYLPVDRAFSVAGHGTVVTGTLRRGALAVSDALELMPGRRPVRIRGLQVHGAKVASALPGQRVALNLRDVEPAQVPRGAALAGAGLLAEARWLTVTVRSVPGAPALPTGTRLSLLFGTEEIEARLRLLDREALEPGQAAPAQLHAAWPVALPAREPFILRRPSPPQTVAGGRVIDPAASRLRRHAPAVLARLQAVAGAGPAGIVAAELRAAAAQGMALTRLAQRAGVAPAWAAALAQALPAVIGRSGTVVPQPAFDRTLAGLSAALAPHAEGVLRDRLPALLPWAGLGVLDDALGDLIRSGAVLRSGGAVRLNVAAREQDRAAREAEVLRRLAEALRRGGLAPPDPLALAPGPQTPRLLERLVRDGVAVRALDRVQKREVVFHRDAIETAKRRLAPLLARPGLLVGEAGAALGISRKYSVPLLEHLDAMGFTRRIADRRVLAGTWLEAPS